MAVSSRNSWDVWSEISVQLKDGLWVKARLLEEGEMRWVGLVVAHGENKLCICSRSMCDLGDLLSSALSIGARFAAVFVLLLDRVLCAMLYTVYNLLSGFESATFWALRGRSRVQDLGFFVWDLGLITPWPRPNQAIPVENSKGTIAGESEHLRTERTPENRLQR